MLNVQNNSNKRKKSEDFQQVSCYDILLFGRMIIEGHHYFCFSELCYNRFCCILLVVHICILYIYYTSYQVNNGSLFRDQFSYSKILVRPFKKFYIFCSESNFILQRKESLTLRYSKKILNIIDFQTFFLHDCTKYSLFVSHLQCFGRPLIKKELSVHSSF